MGRLHVHSLIDVLSRDQQEKIRSLSDVYPSNTEMVVSFRQGIKRESRFTSRFIQS